MSDKSEEVLKLIRYVREAFAIFEEAAHLLQTHQVKTVDEILPETLKLELAKAAADRRAREKFGIEEE